MSNVPTPIENEAAQNAFGKKNNKRKFRIVDFAAFLVCFAVALSVWIFVTSTENEEYEYTFKDVNVEYFGVDQLQNEHGLSIMSEYQTKVNITVKGYRSEIVKYTSEDFYARIDVDAITEEGVHALNVIAKLPEGKMSLVSTSPSTINVNVEETLTAKVPVKVNVQYDIPDKLKLHDPVPEFQELEIVGPKSRVESVAYAEVSYILGPITTSMNFRGPVTLYDAVGNKIENPYVKPEVNEMYVKVKVTQEKEVPFEAVFTAKDTDKYDYKVIFNPQGVVCVGDPLVMSQYNKARVDLGDLTYKTQGDFTVSLKVTLPSDVSFSGGQRDMIVNFTVEKTLKTQPQEPEE